MAFITAIVCLGAVLNLALWVAVYFKVEGMPLRLWGVAQRTRLVDEARALDVLQAAAAARVGGLMMGIQTYHDQLVMLLRAQAAEADKHARVIERLASEAGVALSTASELVCELRGLVGGARQDTEQPEPETTPGRGSA
jgi:hypothetical protein